MPAQKGGKMFNVAVDGLAELAAIPGWLDAGQRELLDKGSQRLADSVRAKAPGGRGGKIARDIEARTLSPTTAVVRSKGLPATRALNRGAYIKPKRGVALRFTIDGRTVFIRRGVRIKARKFFEAGLRSRGKIIRQVYSEAFGDLHKHGPA